MHGPVEIASLPAAAFTLPRQLEGLRRLAYNLYWTWHPGAQALFTRIDPDAWERYRNAVPVLQVRRDWSELLDDPAFMTDYETELEAFEAYLAAVPRGDAQRINSRLSEPVAYFCAEYGLHESLGIYSGGLGVLAGDHLKAASDLAMPFVAVGLFYRHGYFRQAIDADGHQEHAYPDYDPERLPLRLVTDLDGSPLRISVDLPGREVWCAVWVVEVGRVPLLLLDTDIPENGAADRPITHILYVRGREMRLHQEIVLGVGGTRALRALGIRPSVWHLNEGHSALMLVERACELTADGTPMDEALEIVRRNAVFTIHTPVSAGNERFDADLLRRLVTPTVEGRGLGMERLLELGRGVDGDATQFDMTAFTLRLTNGANAVSKLHAATANTTWDPILRDDIKAVTNGVHTPTWVGTPVRELFEDIGADLDTMSDENAKKRFWDRVSQIPDKRLWSAHQRQKLEFAHFARGRLRRQLARHGEAPDTLDALAQALDPDLLTIGFARRFATYKRAALLFLDEERLARLIFDADRPVQIVFAGKAHPADRPGQRVIQDIFVRSRSARLKGRVFVIEDYDIRVARFMVRGVDLWLNNPRRPLEASGTSGMKAAANGVVNCSVLDGWWDEAYDGANGWTIGGRDQDADEGAQDWADAQSLYRLLEDEIVPMYYDRNGGGVPARWVAMMKRSMASTVWRFSTTRMLREYARELYLPAGTTRPVPASRAPEREPVTAASA
jgi:starch phosphorylase